MKRISLVSFLFALFFMLPVTVFAQTTLNEGDIIIVAINGDADGLTYGRGFSFMPLVNLEEGTIINFTDYGWSDLNNTFISNNSVADEFIH